jgi:hypothetical protein
MTKKRAVRIGRPPKRVGERLSKNRTFRVRGKLDEHLMKAAAESGRSVSEEIEVRLAGSFQRDAMVTDVLKVLFALIQALTVQVEQLGGKPISPAEFSELTKAVQRLGEYGIRTLNIAEYGITVDMKKG